MDFLGFFSFWSVNGFLAVGPADDAFFKVVESQALGFPLANKFGTSEAGGAVGDYFFIF